MAPVLASVSAADFTAPYPEKGAQGGGPPKQDVEEKSQWN